VGVPGFGHAGRLGMDVPRVVSNMLGAHGASIYATASRPERVPSSDWNTT